MKPETDTKETQEAGSSRTLCSASDCDCRDWCRADTLRLDGNGHHPNCDKYEPSPPDPRFALFGALMWRYITDHGEEFCGLEWSEDVMPLAMAARLCARAPYDPEKHGSIDADPGDEIWWWGNDVPNAEGHRTAAQPEESL